MTDAQRQLRSDMHGSLNWREPGATVVPSIPRKRRFWWRVFRAVAVSLSFRSAK